MQNLDQKTPYLIVLSIHLRFSGAFTIPFSRNRFSIALVFLLLLFMLALALAPNGFLGGAFSKVVRVPDFSAYDNVQQKKRSFFNYFGYIVRQENARLSQLREQVIKLSGKDGLSNEETEWLMRLAEEYDLSLEQPIGSKAFNALLQRVDIIPSSLVLAQAAIESGWGTSRFARRGYNYFGLWCFRQGCGMLPANRDSGANHEVQVFDSPADSVKAYMLNLNRHPAYARLRQIRAESRKRNSGVFGCQLALGLDKYSSRGRAYVQEVQHMIRANRLSRKGAPACKTAAPVSNEI